MKTYRQLLNHLQSIPNDKLDDTITVLLSDQDEMMPVVGIEFSDEKREDRLDEGHLYLIICIGPSEQQIKQIKPC